LVRIIPGNGRIIVPADDGNIAEVLEQGLWSELEKTSLEQSESDWYAKLNKVDGSDFGVYYQADNKGSVQWSHIGQHNVNNALSAIACARHVGVKPELATEALCQFVGVKRRMELIGEVNGISLFDDFAHHPTAIETTLEGLRQRVGEQRVIAVIEPRSNTMRLGAHLSRLASASRLADRVIWYQPEGLDWSLQSVVDESGGRAEVQRSIDNIVADLVATSVSGDHIVIMSNGGFGGIHQQLLKALKDAVKGSKA
jgi:UDP-N-acetylmuramate: L-alanyl-gamma-D-glutamyl-meso-diaminopimelate ligase